MPRARVRVRSPKKGISAHRARWWWQRATPIRAPITANIASRSTWGRAHTGHRESEPLPPLPTAATDA